MSTQSWTSQPRPPREPIVSPLLTVEEVAWHLQISRAKAYQMTKLGQFPGIVRMGRSVRILRAALERWIDEGGTTDTIRDKRE